MSISIENCNDNPPDIIFPSRSNQPMLIPYEKTETPFIIAQLKVQDRDHFESDKFTYSLIASPSLDINLTDNGTLILCSMPSIGELFTINVTVYDSGNLTNTMSIPLKIYSINETIPMNSFSIADTTLTLLIIFFIVIFLAAILIALCFLIACLLRSKTIRLQRVSARNSSCDSTNSSNERAGSSQKTITEVIDDAAVSLFIYHCVEIKST